MHVSKIRDEMRDPAQSSEWQGGTLRHLDNAIIENVFLVSFPNRLVPQDSMGSDPRRWELATRRRELKEENLHLRVQKESGQLENPARIREIRREVARIETVLTEKRNAQVEA